MARRRKPEAPAEAPDTPPEWLFDFEYASWEEGFSPESPNPEHAGKCPGAAFAVELGAYQRARERYESGAESWLAERGLYARGLREPDDFREFQRWRREEPWRVLERRS